MKSKLLYNSGSNNNSLDANIIEDLQKMLNEHNVLTKSFRMVKEAFQLDDRCNVSLRLIGRRAKDGRMYNLPTIEEVAMLIFGDIENLQFGRDIVVEQRGELLKHINEHHPSYLGLQYPLLFHMERMDLLKGFN